MAILVMENKGYLKMKKVPEKFIDEEGWLPTGDVGNLLKKEV